MSTDCDMSKVLNLSSQHEIKPSRCEWIRHVPNRSIQLNLYRVKHLITSSFYAKITLQIYIHLDGKWKWQEGNYRRRSRSVLFYPTQLSSSFINVPLHHFASVRTAGPHEHRDDFHWITLKKWTLPIQWSSFGCKASLDRTCPSSSFSTWQRGPRCVYCWLITF